MERYMQSLRTLAPDLLRGTIKPREPLHKWPEGRYQDSTTHGDLTSFRRRMALYKLVVEREKRQ